MGAAVKRLTDLVDAKNPYEISWGDLEPLQIAAANERLHERVGAVRLLENRAQTAGLKSVGDMADIVPLLFAHTSYKSYPENWFTQGKWDRMGQWLDTLTTQRVRGVDIGGVRDVDDWIGRLAAVGHYLSCSSGTTGKCSILPASMEDRESVKRQIVRAFTWATGIEPRQEYKAFGLTPMTRAFRHEDAKQCMVDAFAHTERPFPTEPITVGQVSKMVALRRSIGDGTARPADIASFEATSAAREKALAEGLKTTAEAIVASRGDKLLIQAMVATAFQVSEMVRGMGYSGRDFHPGNALVSAGGLKGAKLPPDYRERILDTFNVQPQRVYQFYSMQEINAVMPLCAKSRYHVAPWLILLVLDQTGDRLIKPASGEIEGRAAFFDLSLHGRWGGIITGDKVRVDYGRCACGHQGPTVHTEIVRYSDLPGGDKISCAGTIDAYIRGAA
jgi:hypothetical protein